ncbi:hypothetical protein M408DRAFT_20362 [Serendipita vermifera MAFF 305830]|uniref:Uncharacterized protein n=1 Tax=Serendipita vermifera MAFF 305830 TaxID=933852 RepID=A0A0C3BLX7_SERVB|nr:hypothetical protein M408DRAFT_20362 [Serendipita vermifera MAFF 305830]
MDDSERAAKAARAKALLNKRRANKAPGVATTVASIPSSAHPSPPASTANPLSPAGSVSNLPEEETKTKSPVTTTQEQPFTSDSRRNSRANGSDPYAALIASRTKSPLGSSPSDDSQLQKLVQSQQQTISLLVSEKASLAAALERLEGLDERFGSVSGQLEASKRAAQTLEGRSRDLEQELSQSQKRVEQLSAHEKELSERIRQKERDLDISRSDATGAQEKANELATKLRDLQEQIQADDRVEKLEASLKGLQDRSDSLESQLARVKQSLTETKAEKEELLLKHTKLTESEKALRTERDSLVTNVTNLQSRVKDLEAESSKLQATNDKLAADAKKHNDSISELSRKLSVEGGKAALQEKKIKALQNEISAANRRADDAEHAHKGLQNENVGLMASLNEMRPRVMALTEEKLNLTEHIEKVEESRYELEKTVGRLEVAAEEARARYEALEAEKLALEASRDGDQESMAQEMERHVQAISQAEDELQSALKSVRDLESERAIHRQAVERYQHEMDRLDAELAELRAQYSTLQDDFSIAQNAREQDAAVLEESHGVVERANAEVEALRQELFTKDEELEQLRSEANPTSAKTPRGLHQRSGSLDKEMFESDGTFELSAARSKIRTLETTVFQEQAKAHNLRKHVSSLEEELHRLRRTSRSRHETPSIHSPATSHADLPVSNALDSALPLDVQHKRKISLSMLRARIDGEAALSHSHGKLGASPRPGVPRKLSSTLGTMEEEPSEHDMDERAPLRNDPGPSGSTSVLIKRPERPRPQFLDDSHVFWCSCCRGDLVVL